MRKLALNDEILLKIEKPARYIGNEVNSVMKDPEKVSIRFAMCFPDVYEIGMSHLGIQILYDMFNRRDDVWCERVYSPWTDLDQIMREQKIPLFALESQDPIKDFDFLGITIQYEMCYTNILQVLDLSGIPMQAADRTWDDPIVIGGGPCTYNPEPLAEFFDLFYMGEGETVYDELLNVYKENKKRGGTRKEFLEMAARLIYIKTAALLPRPEEAHQEKQALQGALIEYALCKQAAQALAGRFIGNQIFVRRPMPVSVSPAYALHHDVAVLREAWDQMGQKRFSPPDTARERLQSVVSQPVVSVMSKVVYVMRKVYHNEHVYLGALYADVRERSARVALFLAVPELAKHGRIGISEDSTYLYRRTDGRKKSRRMETAE